MLTNQVFGLLSGDPVLAGEVVDFVVLTAKGCRLTRDPRDNCLERLTLRRSLAVRRSNAPSRRELAEKLVYEKQLAVGERPDPCDRRHR